MTVDIIPSENDHEDDGFAGYVRRSSLQRVFYLRNRRPALEQLRDRALELSQNPKLLTLAALLNLFMHLLDHKFADDDNQLRIWTQISKTVDRQNGKKRP